MTAGSFDAEDISYGTEYGLMLRAAVCIYTYIYRCTCVSHSTMAKAAKFTNDAKNSDYSGWSKRLACKYSKFSNKAKRSHVEL